MIKRIIFICLILSCIIIIWNCDDIDGILVNDVLRATGEEFTLTILDNSQGTAILTDGSSSVLIYEGVEVQISAEPADGYLFSYWQKTSGAGNIIFTDHTASETKAYILDGNCTIQAIFEADPEYVPDTPRYPEIAISAGSSLNDGDSLEIGSMPGIQIGSNDSAEITITNNGEADLSISSITEYGHSNEYSYSISSFPHTIAAGSSSTLTVTFSPQDIGHRTVTATINSNDVNTPAFDIVLNGSGGVWTEGDLLTSPNATYAGSFGYSVDVATVTTLDVETTYLAVGEPMRDTATYADVGVVNMYKYNASTDDWDQETGGSWATSYANSNIGYSVALCDSEDNGEPFMLTGMPGQVGPSHSAHGGRAMVRRRDSAEDYWRIWDTNFGPERILETSSSLEDHNYFGHSVDINSKWAVIGATTVTSANPETGDVYIFNRTSPTSTYYGAYDGSIYTKSLPNTTIQGSALGLGSGAASAEFGWDVSVYDDQLIIGAKNQDTNAGRVFFYRYDLVWDNEDTVGPTYTDGAGDYGDNFGYAVAIHDDVAVIGIPRYDVTSGDDCSGAVQIYTFDGTDWNPGIVIENPDPKSNGNFGYDIALNEKFLIVGAFINDPYGKVYIYEKRGSSFVFKDSFAHSGLSGTSFLGCSVAVDGSFLAAGAYYYDSGKGAVAIWTCE